jgi:phosphatidate cytidylyltransferase
VSHVPKDSESGRSELTRRIIVAVPVAIVLVGVVILSQTLLAAVLLVFGWICFGEFRKLVKQINPSVSDITAEGYLVLTTMIVVARYGSLTMAVVTGIYFGSLFFLVAPAFRRTAHLESFGVGMLGLLWIGLPLACAVQLRGMHHGSWLVVDVLLAVSASDTGAYLGGKAFGRHPLAPTISPHKTVEGWVIGILTATVAVYLLSLFQSWLPTWQALLFGLTVAVVSSLGDLLESFIKRRAGVKDSGTLFGAHGGALDRADAALFGVVAGYALAQLFGL